MPEIEGAERSVPGREENARPAKAIVVGGGVSGCACAAVLATKGVHVTVINSVLDTVGMPGYGPVLMPRGHGWGEVGETMRALPRELRSAWLNAAMIPENGSPVLIVDRRAVSIETKRALERIDGLEFRQGLVVSIRAVDAGTPRDNHPGRSRVVVETFFGEVFEADAVVLAVGLALGGRTRVGADELPGGRYGEMPADGLLEVLKEVGAGFRETQTEVGARIGSLGCGIPAALTGAKPLRRVVLGQALKALTDEWGLGNEGVVGQHGNCQDREDVAANEAGIGVDLCSTAACDSVGPAGAGAGARGATSRHDGRGSGSGPYGHVSEGEAREGWPQDYPPAVHWTESLRGTDALFAEADCESGVPAMVPDGAATAEYYLGDIGVHGLETEDAGGDVATRAAIGTGVSSKGTSEWGADVGGPASRLPQEVRGLAVTSVDRGGRLAAGLLGGPWIWVAGRAGGAGDYLESLRSGARVGEEVAEAVLSRRQEWPEPEKLDVNRASAGSHAEMEKNTP